LNPLSLFELGKFIFDNSMVCCVTKNEQASKLNYNGVINGNKSTWTTSHPQFRDLDGLPVENDIELKLDQILLN
jgi:hypothetical protein